MRKIELDASEAFNEVALLRNLIENAESSRPYTIGQVRLALRVLDKVSGPTVTLEEEEYRFVKERVEATSWVKATPEIVAFIDRIVTAAEVKPEAAPASEARAAA